MKRVTRNRRLNPAEAAKYDAIREKIEQEKPKINARIRQRMADKRKVEASQAGSQTLADLQAWLVANDGTDG